MSINSVHPAYKAFAPVWELCRDAADGERAVKAKETKYLPALSGQTERDAWYDYQQYLKRAAYYGAMGRSVTALAGMMFSRTSNVSENRFNRIPTRNMDGSYNTLTSVHKIIATELLTPGRVGLFVNWDNNRQQPYVRVYPTESITNWEYDEDGILQYVVIREQYTAQSTKNDATRYDKELRCQYIEHTLDDEGYFITRVWRETKPDKDDWYIYETFVPSRANGRIDEIPFQFVNVRELSPAIYEPMLYDLAALNISHYRNSADLEHGLHFTALPTPYAIGVSSQDMEGLTLGSQYAWRIGNTDARVGMLEYTGQGLASIRLTMEKKQEFMAVLAATPALETQRTGVESAESVRLRTGGAVTSLTTVAESSVQAVRWIIERMYWWRGDSVDAQGYDIDRSFILSHLTAEEVTAMFQLLQGNAITLQSFLEVLQQGGRLPENVSIDQEMRKLENATETQIRQSGTDS